MRQGIHFAAVQPPKKRYAGTRCSMVSLASSMKCTKSTMTRAPQLTRGAATCPKVFWCRSTRHTYSLRGRTSVVTAVRPPTTQRWRPSVRCLATRPCPDLPIAPFPLRSLLRSRDFLVGPSLLDPCRSRPLMISGRLLSCVSLARAASVGITMPRGSTSPSGSASTPEHARSNTSMGPCTTRSSRRCS